MINRTLAIDLNATVTVSGAIIRSAPNQTDALRQIIAAHDVVIGLYPGGLHIIKGKDLLAAIAANVVSERVSVTAIECREIEEAKAMCRVFSDEKGPSAMGRA